MENHPHVVVLGAGFSGLRAVKMLSKATVRVTLIDQNNYHTFYPLLYQIGAAEIEPEEIAYPIRNLLRKYPNAEFLMGRVEQANLKEKYFIVEDQKFKYDYAMLCLGTDNHYYGIKGAQTFSYPLKTLRDGINLRNHILSCFEKAVYLDNEKERNKYLSFVVVGGGPTGVEYVGALAELIYGPLKKDFRQLDFKQVQIHLLEGMDRILPIFHPKTSDYAQKKLVKLGVHVKLGSFVQEITSEGIQLQNGPFIPCKTAVWSAGVKGADYLNDWGLPLDSKNQIMVDDYLQVKKLDGVYCCGDLARLESREKALPMIAQVALQSSECAAKNIIRKTQNKEIQPFTYKDKGTMVTLGRNSAVARIYKKEFKGFIAWLIWIFIHLITLVGFRNKILVMINWTLDYFFYEKVIRLIIPTGRKKLDGFP